MKKIYSFLLTALVSSAMVFSTSCKDPAPAPSAPDEPKVPTIALAEVVAKAGAKSAVMAVTVANVDKVKYTYYKRDARPVDAELKWTEKVIEKDGVYEIEITDLESSLTDRTIYTFEAFASLKEEVTKTETCSFQTIKAKPVMIKDVVASAHIISFIAELLPEHCDAFHYVVVEKAAFDKEAFLQEIKDGYVEPVKESTVIIQKYRNPGIDYVIAVQPYWLNEEGKFKDVAAEMTLIDATTKDFELGQCEAAVTMTPDLSSLTFGGVKVIVGRADQSVGGFHFGVVTKADLGAMSIETYLTQSRWFYGGSEYDENFRKYQDFASESNEFEHSFALAPATEYVIFVIADDKYGMIGKVASAPITTPAVSMDDPATVVVKNCVAQQFEVNFDLEFKDDCQKVYYFTAPKGDSSDKAAVAKLVEIFSDPYATDYWEKDGVPPTVYGLAPNSDYDLFMLPASSTGKLGQMVKYTFSSYNTIISFDQSVLMTVTAGELVKFEKKGVVGYKITFTTGLGQGADNYDYGYATYDPSLFPAGEPSDAKVCAQNMYDGFVMGTAGTPTENPTIEMFNMSPDVMVEYVCFCPTNTSGTVKGKPIMFRYEIPATPAAQSAKRSR